MATLIESLENEQWREVKDFPNFEISNLGRLKRIDKRSEYLINPVYRYPCYYMKDESATSKTQIKAKNIHRLVAEHFIENNDSEKTIVNHKDGNKLNFIQDNLEWCTPSQNNIHAYRTGLTARNKNGWGSNNKPVVGLHIESGVVREFGGVRVAERELGLSNNAVKEVAKGRSSHAEGWYFMYYDEYEIKGFPKNIKPIPRFNKKAVQQISSSSGEVLHTFETAREAAIAVGCNYSKISSVCNGHRKSTGGYKWKFVEA